jgi:para-aminobenzoate synthetase/4-amino-4-deoxychorismate lyase
MEEVQAQIKSLVPSFQDQPHKIRLLVAKDGRINWETSTLVDHGVTQLVKLYLAPTPIDANNPFLYHKTTNRQVYDQIRSACSRGHDTLLYNQSGEITETCIYNIIVKIKGELLTPPIACGLLPGTFRADLLERGKVKEKVLTIDMLSECEHIYVVNSVRKWREAILND